MMSYLHTKFHDTWISSFRGVAMTRFWDGRSDCTPRPALAFGDPGKNVKFLYVKRERELSNNSTKEQIVHS